MGRRWAAGGGPEGRGCWIQARNRPGTGTETERERKRERERERERERRKLHYPRAVLTLILVIIYAVAILAIARGRPSSGAIDYLLAGRKLTLPAFVATLVTTWYGGILGVGEYAWRYGISTWVVFGLPYYARRADLRLLARSPAAAKRRRVDPRSSTRAPTAAAPDSPAPPRSSRLTLPVAYLLMLATLLTQLTGWPPWLSVAVGSGVLGRLCRYLRVSVGGPDRHPPVRAHVRGVRDPAPGRARWRTPAVSPVSGLHSRPTHRSWDGGLGWQTVLVWYLIALQTMVEPSFYQRVFAARIPPWPDPGS